MPTLSSEAGVTNSGSGYYRLQLDSLQIMVGETPTLPRTVRLVPVFPTGQENSGPFDRSLVESAGFEFQADHHVGYFLSEQITNSGPVSNLARLLEVSLAYSSYLIDLREANGFPWVSEAVSYLIQVDRPAVLAFSTRPEDRHRVCGFVATEALRAFDRLDCDLSLDDLGGTNASLIQDYLSSQNGSYLFNSTSLLLALFGDKKGQTGPILAGLLGGPNGYTRFASKERLVHPERPFSREVRHVLQQARLLARALGDAEAGTRHQLAALLSPTLLTAVGIGSDFTVQRAAAQALIASVDFSQVVAGFIEGLRKQYTALEFGFWNKIWTIGLPAPLPVQKWVALAGSRTSEHMGTNQAMSAELLGEMFAREGFALVSDGSDGVDQLAVEAMTNNLPSAAFPRVLCLSASGSKIKHPAIRELDLGPDVTTELLKRADALVVVGGHYNTQDLVGAASSRNVPVIPLLSTGGVAAKLESLWKAQPLSAEVIDFGLRGLHESDPLLLIQNVSEILEIATGAIEPTVARWQRRLVELGVTLLGTWRRGDHRLLSPWARQDAAKFEEWLVGVGAANASEQEVREVLRKAVKDPVQFRQLIPILAPLMTDINERLEVTALYEIDSLNRSIGAVEELPAVVVAGNGNLPLEPSQSWSCEALGRLLAREGYRLITGGWKGVDSHVAAAYANELQRNNQEVRRLLIVEMPDFVALGFGSHQAVKNGNEALRVSVELGRAFFVIGGNGGAAQVANAALKSGKLVIPLQGTGGDAHELFQRIEFAGRESLAGAIDTAEAAAQIVESAVAILKQIEKKAERPVKHYRGATRKEPNSLAGKQIEELRAPQGPMPTPSAPDQRKGQEPVGPGGREVFGHADELPVRERFVRMASSEEVVVITVGDGVVRLVTPDGGDFECPLKTDLLLQAEGRVEPESRGKAVFAGLINDEAVSGSPANQDRSPLQAFRDSLKGARGVALVLSRLGAENTRWESIFDGERPLTVEPQRPFYRLVNSQPGRLEPIPLRRILVCICDAPSLKGSKDELGAYEGGIRKQLAGLEARHAVPPQIEVIRIESLDELKNRLLRNDPYEVLHLLCHGTTVVGTATDSRVEEFRFVLPPKAGSEATLITVDLLGAVLLEDNPRVLILSTCFSASMTSKRVSSAGHELCRKFGRAAVVAMNGPLNQATNYQLIEFLYDRLLRSGRIDEAVAAARQALFTDSTTRRFFDVPVLILNRLGARLFEARNGEARDELGPLVEEVQKRMVEQVAREAQAQIGAIRPSESFDGLARAILSAVREVEAVPRSPETGRKPPRQDRDALRSLKAVTFSGDTAGEETLKERLRRHVTDKANLVFPPDLHEDLARCLSLGRHVMLIGPPGTGKTSLAMAACKFAQDEGWTREPLTGTATADWSTFDTIGGYFPNPDGGMSFQPGLFLRAITEGRWLLVDELNRADIDKAIGEFFTLLSGQPVTLPFRVDQHPVRLLPPDYWEEWRAGKLELGDYDYVAHPNWRMLVSLNVYDKASLYGMSNALLRRFAVLDVDPPPPDAYKDLVKTKFLEDKNPDLLECFRWMIDELPVALGPAIVKDIANYAVQRGGVNCWEAFAAGFNLFATSQFDGLPPGVVQKVRDVLGGSLDFHGTQSGQAAVRRLKQLNPYLDEQP
jgi:hypothetical protein